MARATTKKTTLDDVQTSAGEGSKLDKQGRTYGTGRRKDAVARVWIKRGKGKSPLMAANLILILRAPCCA